MANKQPTKWKYVENKVDGYIHVELLSDGTLQWFSPKQPTPEDVQKVADAAVAAGYPELGVQAVTAAQKLISASIQLNSEEQVNKSVVSNVATDPTSFESKIIKYLPSDYKDANLAEIPADTLHKAWADYSKDWEKGTSSLHINDKRAQRLMNVASIYEGNGPYFNQFQTFFSCLDRYGNNIMLTNVENRGVTFITRPRLCLQSTNLRSQRRMSVLDNSNPNTISFAIRALLDSNLNFRGDYTDQLLNCPLVDVQNAFFTPLCNSLLSLSGLPDIRIESATTDGGYMCEAQQYAVGGDDLKRGNYSLNLTFRDIQGGIISSIFYFWMEYIRCVTRDLVRAYSDDIDEQRLNYTVSIYHFNLDPTGNYITDWVKCTGCYPTSMPIGAKLQVNEGEFINRAVDRVSVDFACNVVEYRDYAIFSDFDTLVRRYCPDINTTRKGTEFQPGRDDTTGKIITAASRYRNSSNQLIHPSLPRVAWSNFRGIPWITSDPRGPKLEYRRVSNPVFPRNDVLGMYDEDIADQLTKMDLANQIRKQAESVDFARENYPEYLQAAEEYKLNDLKEFVSKVFNQEVDPFTSQRIDLN